MDRLVVAVGVVFAASSLGCSNSPSEPVGGARMYSVVGDNDFLAVPPPACEEGNPLDSNCDHRIPLDCAAEGSHIDFDPNDDSTCPICVEPRPGDPSTCDGWKRRYGEFLADNISESCVNWCDGEDFVCRGHEISNACGTFAVALSGNIDEETIAFAREFSQDNCAAPCGDVSQTVTGLEALGDLDVACVDHQCVLVAGGAPDASVPSTDAGPTD